MRGVELVLALLLAAVSARAGNNTLHLRLLPDSSPGKCLDGSPGGFFWRPGDPDKFLVVLNGGGWCYDLDDCAERSHTSLGTSTVWPSEIEGEGVTNAELVGNPMQGFSVAYLYYCDGASFASGREDPVPYNETHSLHFRGRHILDEVMAQLLDPKGEYRMDAASHVILAGHSAGGMAAFHAADHVADLLAAAGSAKAQYAGMPDAGFFLPTVPDMSGNFSYRAKMQTIYSLANASAGVNPACLRAWEAKGEGWRCMFPIYEAPHIRSTLFLSQSQYDLWQLENVLILGCEPPKKGSCSAEQMDRFQGFRVAMLAGLHEAGILPPSPTRKIWTDSCIAHSQGYYGHYLTNPDWRVGGQTLAQTIGAALVGQAGNSSEVDPAVWPGNAPCASAGA